MQSVSLTRMRADAYEGVSSSRIGAGVVSDASSSPPSSRAKVRTPSPTAGAPQPARPTRHLAAALVGVALAAVAASVLVRGQRATAMGHASPADSQPLAPPTASAAQRHTAAALGASGTAHVAIRTSPAAAKLYVDGVSVDNPYLADIVRDGGSHTVRAEAPGHATKTRTFTSAADTDLEISLDRDPVQWRGGGHESPPGRLVPSSAQFSSEPPTAPSTDVRAPRARLRRGLDKEDPYAQ